MAKKSKTAAQLKLEARRSIFIIYTLQILIIAYMSFKSPFIADNVTPLIFINGLFSSFIMLYSFDLKNIQGWWKKRWFQAEQRALHKREIKARLDKEMGLGYDKIKR